jgi:hypothetical protein
VLANLAAFEKKYNPDGRIVYGVKHPSKCVADALTKLGAPVNYTGLVDSHPYAVVSLGHGSWAVADAGGNDLLKVDRWGHVSVLAVLPPAGVKITTDIAGKLGLPHCAVGITYNFESVPTDVELGPWGQLYVSTLASDPGPPTPIATGSVWAIGADSKAYRIATGFSEATNIAVDPAGHIFVAELGAGQITELWHGHKTVVFRATGVVGVEYANDHLYASTAPAAAGGDGLGSVVLLAGPHRAS